MSVINWARYSEKAVGAGHPTEEDVVNRPLREVLTASGLDPDADFPGFATVAAATSVAFGDATITETLEGGLVVTTAFNADGTISTTYGAPVSRTVTTTFNADGSISEAVT